VSGMADGTTNSIDQTLTNTTAANGSVVYRVTPTEDGCNGNHIDVSITVRPQPNVTVTPSATEICSQSNITFTLNGTVPGTNYAWTVTTTNVEDFTESNTNSNSMVQTLVTNGPADGTITYAFTPTANGCTGPSVNIGPITVKPLPQGEITTSVGGTITVCKDALPTPVTFTGGNGAAPYTFTYRIRQDGGTLGTSIDITTPGLTSTVVVPAPTGVVGVFDYVLVGVRDATTVGCSQIARDSAVITIRQLPTATFTPVAPVCIGTTAPDLVLNGANGDPIYTFTYTVNNGPNQTVSTAAGQNSVTINPSTAVADTYTYRIVEVEEGSIYGCKQPLTGVETNVVIRPNATVALSSAAGTDNQTVCQNLAIPTNIQYQVGGSGNSPIVTGLPAGLDTSYNPATGLFTISGTPTAAGTFNYTVNVTGLCLPTSINGTINVTVAPAGGTTSIATPTLVCSGNNTGTISLSGQTGNVVRWEQSSTGGVIYSPIAGTAGQTTYTFSDLNVSTFFRAVVDNGVCTSEVYSVPTLIQVVPLITPTISPANPATICEGGSVILTANPGFTQGGFSGGTFNSANPAGWRVTENGVQTNFPADANNGATNRWSETNPGTITGTVFNNNQPGFSGKFAISNGTILTTLETPIFSLVGLTEAVLDLHTAIILNGSATATIEISLDGGATYINVLQQWSASTTVGNTNSGFINFQADLAAYLGQPNVRIRFMFSSNVDNSYWAMENVQLAAVGIGTFAPVTYTWTPTIGLTPATGIANPITAAPTTTTTYTVATSIGNCQLGTTTVTVPVNPLPTLGTATVSATSCTNATVSLTGLLPSTTTQVTYNLGATGPFTANVVSDASGNGSFPVTITQDNAGDVITFTLLRRPSPPGPSPACSTTVNVQTPAIVLPPTLTATIGGDLTTCAGSPVGLTITITGTGNYSGTLSDGTTFSGNATSSPTVITVNVAPSANTTYTITSLTNTTTGCVSQTGDLTGTATVTIPATGTGVWIGSVSSDWFDCNNWDGNAIPTATTNVVIGGSNNHCVINLASPLNPSGNNAVARNVTVSDRNLVFANAAATLDAGGNLTLSGTGLLNMTAGGTLNLSGNWSNSVGTAAFMEGTGTVRFVGDAVQTINSNAKETFHNMGIRNLSGENNGVTLTTPVDVSGVFDIEAGADGRVLTSNTDSLTIINTDAAAVTGGGSNVAYVNGPMIRHMQSTGAYIFPVGKHNSPYAFHRPVVVTPASNTFSRFRVEHMVGTAPDIGNRAGFLAGIINKEYWDVDRREGANARVTLRYINPNNDGDWTATGPGGTINNVAVVKLYDCLNAENQPVQNWNFTDGCNGIGGNFGPGEAIIWYFTPDGEPVTSLVVDQFSPFGFGHADWTVLPIRLITFTGEARQGNGFLRWTVADNTEVKYFVVEHGTDGRNFKSVGQVNKGTTGVYDFTHVSLTPGNNYYR
ncbi:MAG TPA: PKD-like domain-containing protein, partial [Phnomibacter sp.]|nr:PKD-like domain-containing protein [Phnomibacter sp.]